MSFVSYAQNFEDVMLWRALGHVGRGFYIDAGACEPDSHSVTKAFYDRGWSGINIEPAPAAFARLATARPRDINLNLAAGSEAGAQRFLLVDGGNGLSTLQTGREGELAAAGWSVDAITVEVRRLADLCQHHVTGPIHFLKIDVEGAERAVIEGAELTRWRPWVIVVEATRPNSPEPTHDQWEDLLLSQSYRMVYADGLNRFYLAAEQEALAPAFALPPNVFDDFIRVEQLGAATQAARADAAEARLATELPAALSRAGDAEQARDAMAAALAEQEARLATLLIQRDQAIQEMWESNRLAGVLAAERQKLLDELMASQQHHAQTQAVLNAVHASTSWRVTAPLRTVVGRLGVRR
jgi:FkbM family methyltransferase